MTDKAAEHDVSQLQPMQQKTYSGLDKMEWGHGYGHYRYYIPAQDQIHIQFSWGHVSGTLTTGKDSQSDYTNAPLVQRYEEAKALFVLAKQFFEETINRDLEFEESFADEEMTLSVAVEEQGDVQVMDTATDDVLQWTSDQLASAILGAEAEADMPRLREMILAVENTGFTIAQSEKLSPWLLSFATKYRDKNNPQDKAAIWSAIRTGASMLTPSYADRLLPLLEPGHSIETSLVTVKMIGRIFEAQPPAEVDKYPVLANEVLRIAEALLNRYAITVSQSAAMAQLVVYALVAMASSKTQQIVESVRQLGVSWFIQQTQRELRELRDIWASRPIPVAERPLELLDRAIESLA